MSEPLWKYRKEGVDWIENGMEVSVGRSVGRGSKNRPAVKVVSQGAPPANLPCWARHSEDIPILYAMRYSFVGAASLSHLAPQHKVYFLINDWIPRLLSG